MFDGLDNDPLALSAIADELEHAADERDAEDEQRALAHEGRAREIASLFADPLLARGAALFLEPSQARDAVGRDLVDQFTTALRHMRRLAVDADDVAHLHDLDDVRAEIDGLVDRIEALRQDGLTLAWHHERHRAAKLRRAIMRLENQPSLGMLRARRGRAA